MFKPNFKRISNYYNFGKPPGKMYYLWRNGIPQKLTDLVGDERISMIAERLEKLVANHDLLKNYNDLLYLIIIFDLDYRNRFSYLLSENKKADLRMAFSKLYLALHDADTTILINFKLEKAKKRLLSKTKDSLTSSRQI
ncbi:MAG: hypothetical protein JWR05_3386 [Mucilaginibacter sp.]|nr:hypothetical protein [Mucilaginibacter sp.]